MGDIFELTACHEDARAAYRDALTHVAASDRVSRARLLRKIGVSWQGERRMEEALDAYRQAEAALEPERVDTSSEEWREWIEIQCDRVGSYYWLNRVPEMTDLAERLRPVVAQYATPLQRARFHASLWSVAARRDRFVLTDESLVDPKARLAACEEAGDRVETAYAQFALGFVYLWRGELAEAEELIRSCLTFVERIGDVTVESQCLTYLTVVYRKRGQVEQVRHAAERSLEAATAAQRFDYIGAAWANRAWMAWREGNLDDAREHGQAALEWWDRLPAPYIFHWIARWPLIGVALAEEQLAEAVEHARFLLTPSQLRLPDALEAPMQEAIQAWHAGQPEAPRTCLQQAVERAQEMGFL